MSASRWPVRGRRLAIVAALLLAARPAAAPAQREPVLAQVHEPHPYYYREMYLPQLTTGPSAAAWSPDGRELVYSMMGSLWRQRVGDTIAVQLTAGAYDYEPDWSPDGRRVAFARYDGRSVELMVLDLARDSVSALTANGAVNVDPRWSPDGERLAFGSTMYEGRFHVFAMPVRGPTAGPAERLTPDRDSGLPRYYYSRYDHYLSPTWSPDGRELIIISNRGHLMGTGGFWRIPAQRSDTGREIHYEETTWRARPDWSPDGRRVVYSSYLGRQWNQLWLMTADGGDALQLTYGDFDATAPRWSPDGRRIAYVVNEGGNTALRIVDVPGGGTTPVEARAQRWREPVGRLAITVVDERGRPLDARLSVTAADGRSLAPREAWHHADDGIDHRARRFEVGYFHAPGRAALTVPAGRVALEATHGLEWVVARDTVAVPAGGIRRVRLRLTRLADLPRDGWWSADLHVHMNYGGAYRNDPRHLAFQARAEDVHVIESLIVNKEQRVPDVSWFTGRPDPVSTPTTLIVHGQEYHTSWWGHTGLLGLTRHLVLPGYAAYVNTAAASLVPTNADVADLAHAQGALFGYVHPFDEYPEPADTAVALTDELPVDVALGKVDYMELDGFSDHLSTARVWYRLLDCGFRIPAGAGTDAMANFASLRGPVGMNRVYVRAGARLTHGAFLHALKAGRTFSTNGPLLWLTVNGHDVGDELSLAPGRHALDVRVRLRSIVPVRHLELVMDGAVVDSIPLDATGTTADARRRVVIDRSGWITLRAWSEQATPPVLDIYPFATTSPVYVTVGGAPVRSRADAAYFLAWIERLRDAVNHHQGWNTDVEHRHVLALLDSARAGFERCGGAGTAAR